MNTGISAFSRICRVAPPKMTWRSRLCVNAPLTRRSQPSVAELGKNGFSGTAPARADGDGAGGDAARRQIVGQFVAVRSGNAGAFDRQDDDLLGLFENRQGESNRTRRLRAAVPGDDNGGPDARRRDGWRDQQGSAAVEQSGIEGEGTGTGYSLFGTADNRDVENASEIADHMVAGRDPFPPVPGDFPVGHEFLEKAPGFGGVFFALLGQRFVKDRCPDHIGGEEGCRRRGQRETGGAAAEAAGKQRRRRQDRFRSVMVFDGDEYRFHGVHPDILAHRQASVDRLRIGQ